MKNNLYFIAYSDVDDPESVNKDPLIHPVHPLSKEDIIREYNFIVDKVNAKTAIIFKADPDNVSENITWQYVNANKAKFQSQLVKAKNAAKVYSRCAYSELLLKLPKDQMKIWLKEIEQAFIAGSEYLMVNK